MEGFTGRVAAIEVRGAVPTPMARSSNPAMLWMHAASRRWSAPALHEAHILRGAGARTNRIRFSSKPIWESPIKIRCTSSSSSRPCRSTCKAGGSSGKAPKLTLTGGGVRIGSGRGSNGDGTHRGSSAADQEAKGSRNWATMPTCSACFAPVMNAPELSLRRTGRVWKDLVALVREYCRQQHLVHHCGHLRTLRRVVVMGARLLGEIKSENFSYDDLDDNLQKQTRGAVKHAGQAERQGRRGEGAKTKDCEAYSDWVASFMLAQVSFAVVHAASRQIRADGLCSLHWFPIFLVRRSLQTFVSDMIATASDRHTSRWRWIRPRHRRAVTTKHEPGFCRPYIVLSRTAQQRRFGPSR